MGGYRAGVMDAERAGDLRRAGSLFLVGAALFLPAALVVGPQDPLLDAIDDLDWGVDVPWSRIAGVVLALGLALLWAGAGFLADAVDAGHARYAAVAAAIVGGAATLAIVVAVVGTHTLETSWAADIAAETGIDMQRAGTVGWGAALVLQGVAVWIDRIVPRELGTLLAVVGAGAGGHAAVVDSGAFMVPIIGLGAFAVFALGVATRAELAATEA